MNVVALPHEPTWAAQPAAFAIVNAALERICRHSPFLARLATRMLDETGTRLFDWVDRIGSSASEAELLAAGFVKEAAQVFAVFRHPQAQLPAVVLDYGKQLVAIKVDSVLDFLIAHGLDSRCQVFGNPGAALRRCCVDCHQDLECWVVERHGHQGWQTEDVSPTCLAQLTAHHERFHLRRRGFDQVADGLAHGVAGDRARIEMEERRQARQQRADAAGDMKILHQPFA